MIIMSQYCQPTLFHVLNVFISLSLVILLFCSPVVRLLKHQVETGLVVTLFTVILKEELQHC